MSATVERMTTAEVLRRALELLGPNGERWTKLFTSAGPVDHQHGTYCMISSLGMLCQPKVRNARISLAQAIGIWPNNLPFYGIARWNDADERTWPEVKAAFEKAIELAEATQ